MTPNDLRALCATTTPDSLLVTLPLATVRALVAAIDAAAEHDALREAVRAYLATLPDGLADSREFNTLAAMVWP